MTRDELLAALTAERYDNRWWKTTPAQPPDDDVTCARRRREMADDFAAHDHPERKAT
jgi:hypothetical protein